MNPDYAIVLRQKFAFIPTKCEGNQWVWLRMYRFKYTVNWYLGHTVITNVQKLTNADAVFFALTAKDTKIIDN